jgi:mevalonate kinase
MSNLADLLVFVNEQIAFHTSKADEYRAKSPKRFERHTETAGRNEDIKALLTLQEAEISRLKTAIESMPKQMPLRQKQLSLSLDELEGLPEELINELSFSDTDRFDYQIKTMIDAGGGVMSLDQVLVGLYKATNEIHKRTAINNRLYKMTQKEELFPVQGKKGVYATRPLTDEEAALLL